ncbi:carboxylesterase 2 [Acrasis kona]|uniref:Carboxylic ester hydrolase n=1 Tax=Acrasis kona TaxID=1008807 RepID=A0AAW2YW19_9EUKA
MSIATTRLGKINGLYGKPGIYKWKGIRYAKPPVGDLRFRAPVPVEPWEGIINAFKYGSQSPQAIGPILHTNEDCLFLNIWSKSIDGKRPVMFFIHGGAYIAGSGSQNFYDGSGMAYKQDVVVVTINYRLGALGYLHFDNLPEAQNRFDSNCGLRDQVAALKWVKENIDAFGGDPDNITIFGESAGGGSVSTLMAVPSAKGLFHKAISQSGIIDCVLKRNWATSTTRDFVENYLKTENVQDIVTMDTKKLVDASVDFYFDMCYKMPGILIFCPEVDGDVLPEHPIDAIRKGSSEGVPLIIGFNKDEANFFSLLGIRPGKNCLASTIPQVDAFFQTNNHLDKNKIMSCYQSEYKNGEYLRRFAADITFNIPILKFAEAHSLHGPTFLYRYDFVSTVQRVLGLKATHAMELPFVFSNFSGPMKALYLLSNPKSVQGLNQRMQGAWITFARSGNPGAKWPQYNTNSREAYVFNDQDTVVHDINGTLRALWEGSSYYV